MSKAKKQLRNERIESQLQELKAQQNLEVIMCEPDDIMRLDLWIVWVHGRKGTLYESGIYPVKISFPQKYPSQAPVIEFQKQFLHIHVYEGGLICLPLLEQPNWKPKISMPSIIQRIESLIHQDINPYSPANMSLFEMYKSNPQQFQKTLRQQSLRYQDQKLEYFKEPCVHIKINPCEK